MTRLYDPPPGMLVLPLGLPTLIVKGAERGDLAAPIDANPTGEPLLLATRVEVFGTVVGFVCLTPELTVLDLKVGKRSLTASGAGFPSEAAQEDPREDATGLVLPATEVQISQEVSATVSNTTPQAAIVRAYFLFEVADDSRRPGAFHSAGRRP